MANDSVKVDEAVGNALEITSYFIYQKNIANIKKYNFVEELIDMKDEDTSSGGYLQFEIHDNDGEEDFLCSIMYSKSHYKEETIKCIYDIFNKLVSKAFMIEELKDFEVKKIFE